MHKKGWQKQQGWPFDTFGGISETLWLGLGQEKKEGYPLRESLAGDGGSEKVASNGRLYGNEGGKLDVSPLEESLGEYGGYEIGSSSGM